MSITDTGAGFPTPADSGASPRSSAGFRRGLLVVLIALLLVAGGAFIWLAADRLGNEQSGLQAEREQAMSVSEQFMLRLGNHDPSMLDDKGEMPEYRRLVEELATTKLWEQLKGTDVVAAETITDQAGLTRATSVFATGVQNIDDDSATVLLAGQVVDSYTKQAGTEPLAFRYAVQLQKVSGKWLVDGCSSPLTGQQCFSTGGAG